MSNANESPVEEIRDRWGGLEQYEHDDLRGQCVGLVAGLRPDRLPWDEAPKMETAGDAEIVCVKKSRTRCVLTFEIPGPDGAAVRVYAKRCRARNLGKRLASLVRRSKACREWEAAWCVLERGAPTAAPLLWAEKRRRGLVVENYLVTLGVERSVSFRRLYETLPGPEERALWLRNLGGFVRLLHERGLAHDDLGAHHVLVAVARNAMLEAPSFFVIDLDQSRVYEQVPGYRRAHNFFQVFRSMPEGGLDHAGRREFYAGYSHGRWSDEHMAAFENAIVWIRRLKTLQRLLRPWRLLRNR